MRLLFSFLTETQNLPCIIPSSHTFPRTRRRRSRPSPRPATHEAHGPILPRPQPAVSTTGRRAGHVCPRTRPITGWLVAQRGAGCSNVICRLQLPGRWLQPSQQCDCRPQLHHRGLQHIRPPVVAFSLSVATSSVRIVASSVRSPNIDDDRLQQPSTRLLAPHVVACSSTGAPSRYGHALVVASDLASCSSWPRRLHHPTVRGQGRGHEWPWSPQVASNRGHWACGTPAHRPASPSNSTGER